MSEQQESRNILRLNASITPNWRGQLDERQRKDVELAELYIEQFNHGAVGHNLYVIVARLAELLDVATGIKEPPKPPEPHAIVLTFGKHRCSTLGAILADDPDYLHWLAENARDEQVRRAAAIVLRGDAPDGDTSESTAESGDIPF